MGPHLLRVRPRFLEGHSAISSGAFVSWVFLKFRVFGEEETPSPNGVSGRYLGGRASWGKQVGPDQTMLGIFAAHPAPHSLIQPLIQSKTVPNLHRAAQSLF